jgi:hypothetical protein
MLVVGKCVFTKEDRRSGELFFRRAGTTFVGNS